MVVFQDRVPRYPGRVTMTPVSGQANTYDLARADDPVVEGTKINAALFEGFMPGKVGDILISTRTDLGDNWLLCNGDVLPFSYEEFYEKLPPAYNSTWGIVRTFEGSCSTVFSWNLQVRVVMFKKENGVFFIGTSSNTYYTTNVMGDWAELLFNGASFGCLDVAYGNGIWVFTTGGKLKYTSNLSNGVFEGKGTSTGSPSFVVWDGTKFVAVGHYAAYDSSYGGVYFYTFTDPAGTITQTYFHNTNTATTTFIKYIDGYYVVGSLYDGSDSATPAYYYSTDATNWTRKTLSGYGAVTDFTKYKDKYYISTSGTNSSKHKNYSLTTISGSATALSSTVISGIEAEVSPDGEFLYAIRVAGAINIYDGSSSQSVDISQNVGSSSLNAAKFLADGNTLYGLIDDGAAGVKLITIMVATPIIETDTAYAYIKVKEV